MISFIYNRDTYLQTYFMRNSHLKLVNIFYSVKNDPVSRFFARAPFSQMRLTSFSARSRYTRAACARSTGERERKDKRIPKNVDLTKTFNLI